MGKGQNACCSYCCCLRCCCVTREEEGGNKGKGLSPKGSTSSMMQSTHGMPLDDPNHPMNCKQVAPAEFDTFLSGKRPDGKSRGCTDCLCLLLLLASWVCMTGLGVDAITRGDPAILVAGVDYKGRICGFDNGVRNKPLWTLVSWSGAGTCAKKCPEENTFSDVDLFEPVDVSLLSCKDTYNQSSSSYSDYPFYLVYYGECMFQFASTEFLSYCVVDDINVLSGVMESLYSFDDGYSIQYLYENLNAVTAIFSDIFAVLLFICLFGFVGSFIISNAYSSALRISLVTKTIVWGSIWSVFVFALAAAAYTHRLVGKYKAEVPQVRSDREIQIMQIMAYIGFGFALFWLCLILYLKDRLRLAIGLVIETAKALTKMPMLIIAVPVMQVVAYVIFTIPWVYYCVYMASLGTVTTKKSSFGDVEVNYKDIDYSTDQTRAAWFMLFVYFWTAEFIVASGQMLTAMCICIFYFTRDKSRIGNQTILDGLRIICRYHLGTVAFGALLIALVRMARAYLKYLEKYALRNKTWLQKIILKCIQCCMWCLERCIKYINLNAYVQTCIWGTSFCKSAFNAFWLLLRNIARLAAATAVTHFIVIIGKVTVILLTAGWFYYFMATVYPDSVNSLMLPTLVVAIFAMFVAQMFFEVFGMGTTTLLQCFVADEEMFKHDPQGAFADGALKSYLESHCKRKKKRKRAKGRQAKAVEVRAQSMRNSQSQVVKEK